MIFIILLIGFLLRLIYIDQSFWLDESIQALTAKKSLFDIIFNNTADFHPPLSYIISHYWIMFGESETWLRLLPVTFGVGTIYLIYLIGKELFNKKVGIIASLLLSLAPYHIYYSQEFRMYSMITFFVCLSMYAFSKMINGPVSHKYSLLFIITSLAIIYTHYLGGFVFIVQYLYLILFKRNLARSFLSYFFVVGLGFLIWLPIFYQQISLGVSADNFLPGWSQMLSLSLYLAIPLLFVKFIIGRIDFINSLVYLIIIIISFLPFFSIPYILKNKLKEKHLILLLFWLFIPMLLTFIISFKLPMFQPFRLLFIMPAFILIVAYAITLINKFNNYLLAAIIFVFLFCNCLFFFNQNFLREDWRGAVSYLKSQENIVVINAWPETFAPIVLYGRELKVVSGVNKIPAEKEFVKMRLDLVSERDIYYLSYLSQLTDPDKNIEKELINKGYKIVETKDFRGVGFIHHYQHVQ